MANTVYHYAPTSWVNGTTPANATNMNHIETGPLDALSGFNPDFFSEYVHSGIVCTKDGTNANQLDIASGRAYVTQTDGTSALIVVASDNTHTTVTPSTTYHLYLQPDGTWYWSTSNTPQANSLAICSVTTDGSGNINVVTDLRTLLTTVQPGATALSIPGIVAVPPEFHITTTTLQNPLYSFSVPAAGVYRVSGTLYKASGGNSFIYLRSAYTGFHTSTFALNTFLAVSGGNITTVMPLQGGVSTNQLPDGE